MERRLDKKIDCYIRSLKQDICEQIQKDILLTEEDNGIKQKLINYIYQYPAFELNKDDFTKRKRIKSNILSYERCNAKRANGQQCTRRKKTDSQLCGTHIKGTPHGIITDIEPTNNIKKIEVISIDIKGIIYYLDNDNNVYDTEDVISNKMNPRIIAKYVKNGDIYSIPEFNI